MAKFSTEGKYLKWQDLNGADVVLTITRYAKESQESGRHGAEEVDYLFSGT